MFHYLNTPILYEHFLHNLSTMYILDPIFLSHVVSTIFVSDPRDYGVEIILELAHLLLQEKNERYSSYIVT